MNRFRSSRLLLPVPLALAAAPLLVLPARAEIEKVASICDDGICPRWWPKLTVPPGWERDEDASFDRNVNALAPKGESFDDAVTVMYANAIYKPRVPELKTLAQCVAYLEEGDYYLVFVASSHTPAGLKAVMPTFEKLVAGYKE